MNSATAERFKKLGWLPLITVVLPTLAAAAYFGLIASDVYISETRFVIRSPEKQTSSALSSFLRSPGVSVSGDEIYAVKEYVESRDALKQVNKDSLVERVYSHAGIDWFDRYSMWDSNPTFESLFKYYRKKVDVEIEGVSSISTMKVRAYSGRDAHAINERLLEAGEALVNRLSTRGREDLIRFASEEVGAARRTSQAAALAVSVFRNKEGVLDPERQATVQLQLISKLQDELISTKTQLLQLRAFTPENPQIPVLNTRVQGLSKEIAGEIGKIAGGSNSLARTAVEYQRLTLESEFAEKQLASAMASLESARNDARRKQVYLERIVEPNVPDKALEPRRIRGVFTTFVLGLVAWGILSLLLAGLREHQD